MISVLVGIITLLVLIVVKLCENHRLHVSKLNLRIAELEAFQHNHAGQFVDMVAKKDIGSGQALSMRDLRHVHNRQVESWLKKAVDTPNPVDIIEAAYRAEGADIDEKSFNEARNYMSQAVSLKDVMTKTPEWDKSDGLGGHASCIVVDDPWVPGTKLTDEKRQELSEALESLIDRKWDDDAPLVIIQSRVHDEDLPGYIDGTLDYSWLTPTHVRGTHLYSFRSGQWAEIIRIETVNSRPCFKVTYPDGQGDAIAICDHENYETVSRPRIYTDDYYGGGCN